MAYSTPPDFTAGTVVTETQLDTLSNDISWLYTHGVQQATSFPVSPATNDLCFRTDRGMAYYYDGTRWLTTHEYVATILLAVAAVTVSGAGAILPVELRSDYAPYITRCTLSYNVATTNNGTNYWTIDVRGLNAAYTAATTIHTVSTAAATAGAWTQSDAAPSATAAPANRARMDVVATKVGAPGAITLYTTVSYRLIG